MRDKEVKLWNHIKHVNLHNRQIKHAMLMALGNLNLCLFLKIVDEKVTI